MLSNFRPMVFLRGDRWSCWAVSATSAQGEPRSYRSKVGEKMVTTAAAELAITVTDALDDSARAVIADGLAGYNDQKTGYRDYRPLAVLVSDPETGAVVGGLF